MYKNNIYKNKYKDSDKKNHIKSRFFVTKILKHLPHTGRVWALIYPPKYQIIC